MSVRIRLARIGKKKAPFFRIVAIDKRSKRDGEYLENLGTYNPLTGELLQFHVERIQAWIDKGAIPADSVIKLQKQFKRDAAKPVAPKPAPVKKTVVKVEVAPQVEATEHVQAAAQE